MMYFIEIIMGLERGKHMQFTEHETLSMMNVLSYRGKMSQEELNKKLVEMIELVKKLGARIGAPVATTTFSIEGPVMDSELLVPLDRPVDVPEGYILKPQILITNAIKLHHTGNPMTLQNEMAQLQNYMTENKLVPITTSYNVTIKGANTIQEMDSVVIDVYIGVSPNIL